MFENNFAERLKQLEDKLGGVGQLCSAAGVTYPTLKRWKEGVSDPQLSNLKSMSEAANVSLDWLVYGVDSKTKKNEKTPATYDDYVYIPVYNIEVSAGHGMFSEGAEKPSKHLAFRRRWVEARNLNTSKLSAVFTKGDSMEPTIPNGAAIIVDHRRNNAMDGNIYVIRIDDRLWIKRVQWMPKGGLKLISDNQIYETFEIEKTDLEVENSVEIIGQVIHVSYDLPD